MLRQQIMRMDSVDENGAAKLMVPAAAPENGVVLFVTSPMGLDGGGDRASRQSGRAQRGQLIKRLAIAILKHREETSM